MFFTFVIYGLINC